MTAIPVSGWRSRSRTGVAELAAGARRPPLFTFKEIFLFF